MEVVVVGLKGGDVTAGRELYLFDSLNNSLNKEVQKM
jgi:hypothetical protein